MTRVSTNFGKSIIGQGRIKELLAKQLELNTASSSYLFIGLRDLGKQKLAHEFAAALLCSDQTTVYPCGKCESCKIWENGKDIIPDFYEVTLPSESSEISTDEIRDLKIRASQTALGGSRKVIIVNHADKLSTGAENALLKLLEEPPKNTHILLLHNMTRPVMETIESRCQILRFTPPSVNEVIMWLISNGCEKSVAEEIAFVAKGRPEKARLYLDFKETFADAKNTVTMLAEYFENPERLISELGFNEKMSWAERQEKARDLLESYLFILRSALLKKLNVKTIMPFKMKITNTDLKNIMSRIRNVENSLSLLSFSVPGNILIEHSLYA